ncbi:Protein of unknown function [Pseudonocardia thermophila]|jgi:Protein of unknown function (DUF2505).|uniref:DUF2505 domain-containing protein n=1 Tax=Pseudonocardia thermophila TaxID=1848 RepID=A0A1M6YKC8_PSETH|nr:DUF2505 domain-containing protein [Pseudonocardia thermophila]SHL18791.1 Protein of unknown function [Pseudonocardia thermophila]
MPTQIDYRYTSAFPADALYGALVDEEFLRARLGELGGREAAIVSHRSDPNGARFTLRHELEIDGLPSSIRSFLPGQLTLERTEVWVVGPDARTGTVDVKVIGAPVPAKAGGRLAVADAGGGSEYRVVADVSVSLPLFGGKVEEFVAGKVRELLALESQFTDRWLEQRVV